jgi:serine/threonine protein kinase
MGSDIRITAEDIFHRAADLAVRERAGYLDRACAGNPALRREVEDLLRFDEVSDAFLEKPALQDAARDLARNLAAAEPLADTLNEEDWTLGPYRIRHQIGKGGMGIVYLARDTRDNRDVALKVLLHDSDPDEDRLARFTREGRMLAELKSLKHPNIAEIYEQAEYDGKPCIALEYVPGDTLAERLRQGPLPVSEALQYALQIADALKSAHDQRIVHRDLKPANIKITPEGAIKVLDFGLAKRIYGDMQSGDEHNTRSLSLTESGMLLGTPAYMSPEQWNGQGVDQRSDLWAFGCLLYEMLTGEAPFVGKNRAETMKAVFAASPDWNALPQSTPLVVQNLIRQCFVRNPAARLREAGEAHRLIAEAISLNRFALMLFLKSQFWRLSRRTKQAMAWGTITLALVLAWQFTPLPDIVSAFAGGTVIAEGDDLATVLNKKMNGKANLELIRAALMPEQQSSSDLLALDDSLLENRDYREALDEIIKTLNEMVSKEDPSSRRAYLFALIAQAHLFRYYLASDIQDKEKALQACSEAKKLAPQAIEVQVMLGELFNAIGLPDEAIYTFQEALKNPQSTNNPKILHGLASSYYLKEDNNQAEILYGRAITECERQSNGRCATYYNERGAFYSILGKYSLAKSDWQKVISQDQLNPFAYSNLGSALFFQGCIDEAIKMCNHSLSLKTTVDGYTNRGTAYFFQKKYLEAIKDFERVAIYGQDLPDSGRPAGIWGNLGDSYRLVGRTEHAIEAYRQAIRLGDSQLSLSPDDPELLALKAEWIAKLISMNVRDSNENPEDIIEQAISASPTHARSHGIAVIVYFFSGKTDKALNAAQRAVKAGYSAFALAQNPEIEELKRYPKFQQILEQVKSDC